MNERLTVTNHKINTVLSIHLTKVTFTFTYVMYAPKTLFLHIIIRHHYYLLIDPNENELCVIMF